MKIALITDTHWGVRGDSSFFHDMTRKFLNNIFFPYLEKNNITTVIHLGDLVDRRKYINFYTANRVRQDFLIPLSERNIDTYIIAGNHDCYHKNTNEINALKELVDDKFQFKTYDMPTVQVFDNTEILLLPWICEQNRQKSIELINSTSAQICMGHLELAGFPMHKGHIGFDSGDNPSTFKKFDLVFSGHYHTRSHKDNIHYLGCHSEFTWADYNDSKGFHIFDTTTRELEFIENPYKIFKKIFYDDTNEEPKLSEDISSSIVKVVIKNKNNPYHFDKFIEQVELSNPIEVQIVEDHLNLHLDEEHTIIDEAESTIDIFKKYIDKIETSVNKQKLEGLIIELYNEAISLDEAWQ